LDGQLKDCDLTLKEITLISDSFKATLRSMFHNRITYPKDETELELNGSRKSKDKSKDKIKSGTNENGS